MRQRLLIGISAVCLIVAGAGIMSVAAVDRDEAAQNAAIDRLNCETFGEDCATPEPDATDVPATATQPQEPTLAGAFPDQP